MERSLQEVWVQRFVGPRYVVLEQSSTPLSSLGVRLTSALAALALVPALALIQTLVVVRARDARLHRVYYPP